MFALERDLEFDAVVRQRGCRRGEQDEDKMRREAISACLGA